MFSQCPGYLEMLCSPPEQDWTWGLCWCLQSWCLLGDGFQGGAQAVCDVQLILETSVVLALVTSACSECNGTHSTRQPHVVRKSRLQGWAILYNFPETGRWETTRNATVERQDVVELVSPWKRWPALSLCPAGGRGGRGALPFLCGRSSEKGRSKELAR